MGMQVRPGMPLQPQPMPKVRVTDPNVIRLLQIKDSRIMQLESEIAVMATKLQHFIGVAICILQAQPEPVFRMDFEKFQKIPAELAINTRRDDATNQIVIEVLTSRQAAAMQMGLIEDQVDLEVPRKPPFKVKLPIPDGGRLAGIAGIVYRGGKSDGTALNFVRAKPKKPREFTVNEKAECQFTTDSAGMAIRVTYAYQPKQEAEAESEPEQPLACKDDWHTHENDGDKYIGRCCPICGDPRKLISA